MLKEKEANVTFEVKQHRSSPSLPLTTIIILIITIKLRHFLLSNSFLQLLFNDLICVKTLHLKHQNSLTHQHSVCLLHRNPPPDHWALISGLPTYVAESGYVSV